LDVRGNVATIATASVSGATTFAESVIDQSGSGDIFAASKSGSTKFVVNNSGNLQFSGGTNFLTTLTSIATAIRTVTFPDASGTVCVSGQTCSTTGVVGYFQRTSGALAPANITDDLLLGSTATISAKFAFINNIGAGTPTASISANNGNNATFLTGAGVLGTTNGQTLTLGSASTGNVLINPGSGILQLFNANNSITSAGNLTLAGTTGINLTGNGADINFTGTGDDTITTASGQPFSLLPGGSAGIGINTITPLASLDVRGNLGTTPVASISGKTSFAALVVNNSGSGDLFTASSSGLTRFVVTQNGNVGIGTNTPGTLLDLNSGTSNVSGLKIDQITTSQTATGAFTSLLGVDSSGNVGLASLNTSVTNAALAYWDGQNDPTTGSQASPIPTLGGNAAFSAGNGIQLTSATNNQSGSINWNFNQLPYEEIEFNTKAGGGSGADGVWFYSYADSAPTTEYGCNVTPVSGCNGTNNFTNGYIIYFSEFHGCVGITYGPFKDGNQCNNGGGTSLTGASPLVSTAVANLADNQFHAIDIVIRENEIIVRRDGVTLLDYRDVYTRGLSNASDTFFGFG
ncbi:MAG TPA: hypothetical protein VNZ86_11210, partial [Bacteroidia bacterium]|nr:hypothetical protein [Bacteroidia bacterium]